MGSAGYSPMLTFDSGAHQEVKGSRGVILPRICRHSPFLFSAPQSEPLKIIFIHARKRIWCRIHAVFELYATIRSVSDDRL